MSPYDKAAIEIIQAHANGQQILFRRRDNQKTDWLPTPVPVWNFAEFEYMVLPELREYWINIHNDFGHDSLVVHKTKEQADRLWGSTRVRCVHVKEVDETLSQKENTMSLTNRGIISIVQAFIDGKQILVRPRTDHRVPWAPVSDPSWNFADYDYKIKPKLQEYWINIYRYADLKEGQFAHKTKEQADKFSNSPRVRCVHVREVNET